MVQLVLVNQKNKKGGRPNDGHDSDDSMGSEADDQVPDMGEREGGGEEVQRRSLTLAPSFKILSLGELRSQIDIPLVSETEEKQRDSIKPRLFDDDTQVSLLDRVRVQVRETFEDPSSSNLAYWLAVTILILIILSSISFCAETVEAVREDAFTIGLIESADYVFISVFTLEYVVRLAVSGDITDMYAFVTSLPNLVDLVAILPFYIELLIAATVGSSGGGFDLRFLRLARVFRVFKLSRYGHRMQLIVDALQESREILLMLSVNLVILVVVFSSITFYAEKNEDESAFTSIPATCWWCVVTVLTVGYGDMAPTSVAGKLIATVLMFFSLLVMALPITIIGSSFSNSWMAYKDEAKHSKRRETLPRRFRDIFPGMNTFCNEWNDYNDSFRDCIHEMRSLNDEMQMALDAGDTETLTKLLGQAESLHVALTHHLNSTLQWTSSAMETVLNDWTQSASETRKHFKRGNELLQRSTQLLQRGAVQVIQGDDKAADVNRHPGVLMLHIFGGRNLPVADINGTSDPYVVFFQGERGVKQETDVVQRSLNPMFDEHKVMMLSSLHDPVSFEVIDSDPFRSVVSVGFTVIIHWFMRQLRIVTYSKSSSRVEPIVQSPSRSGPQMLRRGGELMCKGQLPLASLTQGKSKTLWLPLKDANGKAAGELKVTALIKRNTDLRHEDLTNIEMWPSIIEAARDHSWMHNSQVAGEVAPVTAGGKPDSSNSDDAHTSPAATAAAPAASTTGDHHAGAEAAPPLAAATAADAPTPPAEEETAPPAEPVPAPQTVAPGST